MVTWMTSVVRRAAASIGGVLAAVLSLSVDAAAQTSTTLWTNVTLDWVRNSITYEVDFEPKVLLSAPEGEPRWRNLDITPSIEYAAGRRIDLTGEFVVGHTAQTDDLRTTELTLRGGVRFHLVENPARRRVVIRDWVRVESRNLFYSNDDVTDSTVRFRNRLELLVPLNKRSLSDDGVVTALTDWEWFIPWSDPTERFASRQRIRMGASYRRSRAWRYFALYIRNRSRNTLDEAFTTGENVFNFQARRVW
jgi:hypothetical protein